MPEAGCQAPFLAGLGGLHAVEEAGDGFVERRSAIAQRLKLGVVVDEGEVPMVEPVDVLDDSACRVCSRP